MRTISLKRNKKGVSPIIATLLLIVIAVAAAVVTYAFVTGFIGTATSQSNQQGQMSIDTGTVNATTGLITVYVRDAGTKSEVLTTAYVDNVAKVATWGFGNATLAPNQVMSVTIAGAYNDAQAHTVKIVAQDGTPVAYSVHS